VTPICSTKPSVPAIFSRLVLVRFCHWILLCILLEVVNGSIFLRLARDLDYLSSPELLIYYLLTILTARLPADDLVNDFHFIKFVQNYLNFPARCPQEHWSLRIGGQQPPAFNQIESEIVRPEPLRQRATRRRFKGDDEQAVVLESRQPPPYEVAPTSALPSRQCWSNSSFGAQTGRAAGDRFAILARALR